MISKFIVIGENIHCTRILKRGGAMVPKLEDGREVIAFESQGRKMHLPIPDALRGTGDWEAGKVKHFIAAMRQGFYGHGAGRQAGLDYIQAMARKQEENGAAFLDINVDEFSTDVAERVRLIKWAAGAVQQASRLPLSIDTSNEAIMRAGLEACDPERGRPMINSVSLERLGLLPLVAGFKPAVVASAAGATALPRDTAERMANLKDLIPRLLDAGLQPSWIYVDPLVYTISTDPGNGAMFLDAVRAIRAEYGPEIHIIGGLSNISFGMPNRKLINQVFARMCVEAGGDGGIVDPAQINAKLLNALAADSEGYKLARALLAGEDEFGVNFIEAFRGGRIK
ncbi:MAG: dihydropteroate synthase [Lentisphaerae bacterium]|nr:dihydropteroate synthase [Lentisphaerota bacterium]